MTTKKATQPQSVVDSIVAALTDKIEQIVKNSNSWKEITEKGWRFSPLLELDRGVYAQIVLPPKTPGKKHTTLVSIKADIGAKGIYSANVASLRRQAQIWALSSNPDTKKRYDALVVNLDADDNPNKIEAVFRVMNRFSPEKITEPKGEVIKV